MTTTMTTNLHLKRPPTTTTLFFAPKTPFQVKRFPFYKRRRFKRRNLAISNFHVPTFSHFLAPALGLAYGITLYLSQYTLNHQNKISDIGEWLLFTSPTPFNRFVLLRCPTISFGGRELSESLEEKLVEEERHSVRLNSGRIIVNESINGYLEDKLEYQRVCLSTKDGGVISLDWPANLELTEEHGLDSTLLLVPGTTEGGNDKNVRSFVCEALRRGFFPVVMNPRGCAGSPLTTARLFTAADSDDIYTAIQFISKSRSWTTLMGVGWGYGANMLTKHLAEVGERTPLTAATCINNPFDLEEVTRCSPYHEKLIGGLVDILRSNKELFQGRAKGFDVEKALMAETVRDFEKAISMISYGFEEINEFYSKSSTRGVIGNVRVPVLFIQSEDGTVPLFSIPRSMIAENPFTSLLLCSCKPAGIVGGSVVSWCQNLTLEWLMAVELGLLKGRHPLLKDVDVTIKPLQGLALAESSAFGKGVKANNLLELTFKGANRYTLEPTEEVLSYSNTVQSRSSLDPQENFYQKEESQEETPDPLDEKGRVLQTAQVVMNMLDITMPGTLAEEEKKKVLTAVGQGETVLKAFQDAVPADVRGKLTTSVSAILQAQRSNFKFDGLLGVSKTPNGKSGLMSKAGEKVGGASSSEGVLDPNSSEHLKRTDGLADSSGENQPGSSRSYDGLELEVSSSGNTQRLTSADQLPATTSHQEDTFGNKTGNDEISIENTSSGNDEKGVEPNAKRNLASQNEKAGSSQDSIGSEPKVEQDVGITQLETKRETNTRKNEHKVVDSSTDQHIIAFTDRTEDTVSTPEFSEHSQPVERKGDDSQKREIKNMQPVDHNKPTTGESSHPTFNVVQALDALTEIDDSTQVAVNSVFGVIENMIAQLEEMDDENATEDGQDVDSESAVSIYEATGDSQRSASENAINGVNMKPENTLQEYSINEHDGTTVDSQDTLINRCLEEEQSYTPTFPLSNENAINGFQGNTTTNSNKVDKLVGADTLPNVQSEYFSGYFLTKMQDSRTLDLDTTTALLLYYFPEDGQWKLLDQPGSNGEPIGDVTTYNHASRALQTHYSAKPSDTGNFIEPSYIVMDTERQQEPVEEFDTGDENIETSACSDERVVELMQLVKSVILDALGIEVGRKLSVADRKQMKSHLFRELDQVADAVSLAIGHDKVHTWSMQSKDSRGYFISEKLGTLHSENIIKAISSAVLRTSYLRRVLPVGVIIGSSLAALRKYFDLTTAHDDGPKPILQTKISGENNQGKVIVNKNDQNACAIEQSSSWKRTTRSKGEEGGSKNSNNDSIVVGAVTAALGASALLVQQQNLSENNETLENSSKPLRDRRNHQKLAEKLDEGSSDKHENIVTSLAEKAMSVAAPVVPTKEDGEVDQERLVAMLAELGQKGGLLKLVGKFALLWGGIRGAMSLTDRLISFLRLAERPLYQRVIGFLGMALVLWSPIIVPLLPTIVQSWTTKQPSRFSEFVCMVGLYVAVMILVMLWGKRIRGHENPFEQYGLDPTSSLKIQVSLWAMIGGVVLLFLIQTVNALLGSVSVSWPSSLPSSVNAMSCLRLAGQMIVLVVRGLVTVTGLVLVEELLFRSWLAEEIAADLGYHRGIIISGFAFSLSQRSPWAIPGLWLLSLALSGLRERSQGSLAIPIGLRVGIMASSFVLQTGGLLTYNKDIPLWISGTHTFQPFSGVVGFAFSLVLAIIFYPWQPLQDNDAPKRTNGE